MVTMKANTGRPPSSGWCELSNEHIQPWNSCQLPSAESEAQGVSFCLATTERLIRLTKWYRQQLGLVGRVPEKAYLGNQRHIRRILQRPCDLPKAGDDRGHEEGDSVEAESEAVEQKRVEIDIWICECLTHAKPVERLRGCKLMWLVRARAGVQVRE